MNLILDAARYAERWHRGQFRKYYKDIPYITHPARVAARVSYYPQSNEEMVAAAWLHDVVEDCGVTAEGIQQAYPGEVSKLVLELTNPSKQYMHLPRERRKAMDRLHIKNISLAGKVIKAFDRMDNLLDVPPSNQDAVDFMKSKYYHESDLLFQTLATHGLDEWLIAEFQDVLIAVKNRFSI